MKVKHTETILEALPWIQPRPSQWQCRVAQSHLSEVLDRLSFSTKWIPLTNCQVKNILEPWKYLLTDTLVQEITKAFVDLHYSFPLNELGHGSSAVEPPGTLAFSAQHIFAEEQPNRRDWLGKFELLPEFDQQTTHHRFNDSLFITTWPVCMCVCLCECCPPHHVISVIIFA